MSVFLFASLSVYFSFGVSFHHHFKSWCKWNIVNPPVWLFLYLLYFDLTKESWKYPFCDLKSLKFVSLNKITFEVLPALFRLRALLGTSEARFVLQRVDE